MSCERQCSFASRSFGAPQPVPHRPLERRTVVLVHARFWLDPRDRE